MKEFTVTVGTESATIKVPSCISLTSVIDAIESLGCEIKEPEGQKEMEPHEELGISFSQWFREYVSQW